MRIYCDTDTLLSNIRHPDEKCRAELAALQKLLAGRRDEGYSMFRSLVNYRELMETFDDSQKSALLQDYESLEPVRKDEKVLGMQTQEDRYGGCVVYPLVSDVQDEAMCQELTDRGIKLRDAQHITQAICNACDVFLTRDEGTIIKRHRQWIEQRFPMLRVRLPSELAAELFP